MEKFLNYFDKGFDHYQKYKRICNEYEYSAPLISALQKIDLGGLAQFADDFWEKRFRTTFSKNIIDELRKNPKYDECFE